MGCRCAERADALRRAASAMVHGQVQSAVQEIKFAGRTLVEDTRSGALRRAATAQLTKLRAQVRR